MTSMRNNPISAQIVGGLSFVGLAQAVVQGGPNIQSEADLAAMDHVRRFIHDFLARGHVDLGRSGPVCPFIRGAARLDTIRVAVSTVGPGAADQLASDVCATEIVFDQLVKDLALEENRVFATAILILPGLASDAGIDLLVQVQREAKLRFVQQGRMIGQFYPGCPESGLHNEAFRPLDAAVPFLAIRHMALQDAPFMLGDHRYRQSYLERFGEEGARRLVALQAPWDDQRAMVS